MKLERLTTPQRVSAVAILVVVIGAFLPWAALFGMSKAGIQGDGVITLVLAIIGAVVLLLTSGAAGAAEKASGKVAHIALIVLAALVAIVGIVDMNGVAAVGLYLTFLGGLAWLVGAVWDLTASKAPAPPAP